MTEKQIDYLQEQLKAGMLCWWMALQGWRQITSIRSCSDEPSRIAMLDGSRIYYVALYNVPVEEVTITQPFEAAWPTD